MRKRLFGFLALTFSILLAASAAMAHHNFGTEYDATKPITLRGYVSKVEWTNPHAWIYINVKEADGSITNWGFELGSPGSLQSRGWTRTTLKLGDELVVEGTLARNGSKRINSRSVTLAATGQKLGTASSQNGTSEP